MEASAAIFLDKDGTLIPDIPYNVVPERITLNEHVAESLYELQKKFKLIVVSNQAGVAKGLFAMEDLQGVQNKMISLFQEYQVKIDGFYFCPHYPSGKIERYAKVCNCRKPKPGMLLEAARAHHIDLSQSWMIGDILNDVQAGKSVGCKAILIDNGNETEWDLQSSEHRVPDYIAADFGAATAFINRFESGFHPHSEIELKKNLF